MISRITRILLLVQLGAAIALGMLAMNSGHIHHPAPAFLFGLGVVVLIRALIVANNFFLAYRYRGAASQDTRLSWSQLWRLFLEEFKASMLSSSWTMAFFRFEKCIAQKAEGLPVLLIHGYGCNSGYWHDMSKALAKANISHYAIDLEPIFSSIEDYAPAVQKAVQAICKETGHQKIIIVAHSMGGLVARAYLRAYGSVHVTKIITLGTPHNGTGLAKFGLGRNSRQMRREHGLVGSVSSDWLRKLQGSEDKTIRKLFISIYSHHDNIIAPQLSSYLEEAENIELYGIGHVSLALHPLVQSRVIKEIQKASQNIFSKSGVAFEGSEAS